MLQPGHSLPQQLQLQPEQGNERQVGGDLPRHRRNAGYGAWFARWFRLFGLPPLARAFGGDSSAAQPLLAALGGFPAVGISTACAGPGNHGGRKRLCSCEVAAKHRARTEERYRGASSLRAGVVACQASSRRWYVSGSSTSRKMPRSSTSTNCVALRYFRTTVLAPSSGRRASNSENTSRPITTGWPC